MKKQLKKFQIAGAEFLAKRSHALLADEMGLGKTVTAPAAAEKIGARDVLVVCPASVRTNWRQEVEECGLSLRLDLISYNQAAAGWVPLLPQYDLCILDEAHFLKTPTSQRTQAIFGNGTGLARRAQRIWALTGTPVLNRPRELFPLLATCASKAIAPYNNWERFTQQYCGAFFDGRGMNTRGASNVADLRKRLEGFMLRRTKEEVLPELPPRIINRPPLNLSEKELAPVFAVEDEISNREAYLSGTKEDYAQLGDLSRMRKAIGLAKAPAVAEFVDDLLETLGENGKVVIFAHHRDVIKVLDKELGHYCPVIYAGGMSDEQKKRAVSEFVEQKNVQVFIGQIQAAGTGINGLQGVSHTIVFGELSWVPGEMAQAIDRCHRIGQTASSVDVFLPHVPGTLESAMLQVHARKQGVIDALVGAGPTAAGELDGAVADSDFGAAPLSPAEELNGIF